MKKIFTTVIAILLTINAFAIDVWDGTASPWTHGTGVSSDPYLIETAENLAYLAQKVNEGYQAQGQAVFKGVYFLMTDDLDLNNINWTPIGNVNMNMQGYYFAGIFDGWYHKIDNLYIQTNVDVCGLFAGAGGNAIIQHLLINNGNIVSTGAGAGGIVGGIADGAYLYQCVFSGTISVNNSGSYCGAGGITAVAAGGSRIRGCASNGSIILTNNGGFTGAASAGGIVGIAMDNINIARCYNTGNITANAMFISVAAGIVGATVQEDAIIISECYNVGTINAGTKGGIFGMTSPINPTKDETIIHVLNSYYLNTCGGTTNYGTSMTSAEMQTEEFKDIIDINGHDFVMDNGTNNGYPILSLSDYLLWEASEITPHTAKISAEIHAGNDVLVSGKLYYARYNNETYNEIEFDIEDHVELILENLHANDIYKYYMILYYSDGQILYGEGTHYFFTAVDDVAEFSASNIQIYPNPTSDYIYIENIKPQSVSIYSLDGKLIKSIENANVIVVRDLNEGVYLINIDNAVLKFVIQR